MQPAASTDWLLKPKDLCGVPWRVAFALQQDGWYLRSDIVWAKPNPMPESVTDRPTKSHEYVFLLTRQPRYWFDAEAVREPHAEPWRGNGEREKNNWSAGGTAESRGSKETVRQYNPAGRNIRSVWQIATQPYPEAHFATFPEELARRCILAGCPLRVCRVCGKPSERLTDVAYEQHQKVHEGRDRTVGYEAFPNRDVRWRGGPPATKISTTLGWSDCGHESWRPGVTLDPFVGSGTVCKVARDHNRHAIGIDLNVAYLELAARRLQQLSLLSETAP